MFTETAPRAADETGVRSPREGGPPTAAALLLPLVGRIPAMAAPCRMHPAVERIELSLAGWAREVGLEPPEGARFERMAGRAFAGFGVDAALLFAKWLTWLFHFDDEWDEKPAGHATEIVEATFARLGRLAGAVPPRTAGGTPVEVAFQDLWRLTAGRMSTHWRERFARGLREQGAACRTEAENRRTGRVPSVGEYPALRRGTAGPYLFDLVEPCLGVEVPPALRESPTWRTLVDACNDVTAWCNDVASYPKERAHGDVHNYVTVAADTFGFADADAVAWVNDRIAERAGDLRAAAIRLPEMFDRFGIPAAQARDLSKVACAFLAAPRAQLEWLLESSRYGMT
ncbi:terpene synthase family protein [Streptosporangium sp. NBC_01756]|uniref:terpene synthase family protein n=1 Tax=Streptosporangium sp. NBC_01756 TaxID=2975950 RepID=UPI002DD8179C|nr:terpene synthase family protein [Streptosporangium sp. NBC_01756]WSC84845.1 terpene synthase family protein [Streptosporangium sp. NBC_01756]